jgi:hypothetical protein
MGRIMSEEIEALEKRLEKLEPLKQDVLAAKILENWQYVKGGKSSAAPPVISTIIGDASSASPRSCCFASLSLCSAIAGAIVGAAAMFLGMTFFTSPKVEIREIVREVRVKAEPASDVKAKPETKPADHHTSPAESGSENRSLTQPKAKKSSYDRLDLCAVPFRDLDSLLAERNAIARQMARYESNAGPASSGLARPRISPEEYRELLRELKL